MRPEVSILYFVQVATKVYNKNRCKGSASIAAHTVFHLHQPVLGFLFHLVLLASIRRQVKTR